MVRSSGFFCSSCHNPEICTSVQAISNVPQLYSKIIFDLIFEASSPEMLMDEAKVKLT